MDTTQAQVDRQKRWDERKANAKPMTPEQAAQWAIRPDRLPTQVEMDRAEKAVLKE